MFDAVRNNKRIVQIFLGLITLPFAFFGIDSYVRGSGAGSDMAKVGDSKIEVREFQQAVRERQEQFRQNMGAAYKAEMMNSPEVRLSILNGLIDRRLLMLDATKKRLATGDDMLRAFIGGAQAFQDNGQFSMARFQNFLRTQSLTQQQFEARVRQDLTLQQLVGVIASSAFVSKAQAEAMLRIQSEERQFSEFLIPAAQFAAQAVVDAAAVRKYYDDNQNRFEVPEQVKAEFVVLSQDALLAQSPVTEAEISAWYESHRDRYQQSEERRASHILIPSEGEAGKEKARSKAEDVLKEVRRNPAKFAELARQHSKDPGSAQKGGDLGFFGRGMMAKPFEEAAYALKDGEISGVVESDNGAHIIKLTGIKAARQRPLAEVRGEIESDLRQQSAARKFAEAAEAFNNTVYEQADSLQPVAEKFKLSIQRTGWLPKNPDAKLRAAFGPLGNERVLNALFSQDAVKDRRNTEAVEIAPNTLLSARVVEHVPASVRPFDTVKGDIEKFLRNEAAMAEAKRVGEARLTELSKGEDKLRWSSARKTSRLQFRQTQLSMPSMQAIFKADVRQLPSYAGVPTAEGYALYKITEAAQAKNIDESRLQALSAQYAGAVAQEDLAAYLSGLRARYKVDVNTALLESKEAQ